jgi:mono/diheme cytochrome c family protein
MSRGRNRYETFCAPCHDLDGSARSPVAINMQLRHPPALLDGRIRALPAGRVFQAITQGYGLMPSYAHQLSVDERWGVVAYVRALQLSQRATLAELPPDVRAEAETALAREAAR